MIWWTWFDQFVQRLVLLGVTFVCLLLGTKHPLCDCETRIADVCHNLERSKELLHTTIARQQSLFAVISAATHSIIIHTCIVAVATNDTFAEHVFNLLWKRVQCGVHVTIVCDATSTYLSNSIDPRVRFPWIQWILIGSYSAVGIARPIYHRKFIIIDQIEVMVTGANLTHEYYHHQYWDIAYHSKDRHLVQTLHAIHMATLLGHVSQRCCHSQIVHTRCGSLFLTQIVPRVQQSLLVYTGIFQPSSDIMQALLSLVQRRVQVTVCCVSPSTWGHLDTYHYVLLRQAGIQLREAAPGSEQLHGKAWIMDHTRLWIGSCNLSTRSFHQDYELMLEICDPVQVKRGIQTLTDTLQAHTQPCRWPIMSWIRLWISAYVVRGLV
jgi:phosphatidylserine/phosphatidylglycerophosphate/cardiolipin synthase-like enzyme